MLPQKAKSGTPTNTMGGNVTSLPFSRQGTGFTATQKIRTKYILDVHLFILAFCKLDSYRKYQPTGSVCHHGLLGCVWHVVFYFSPSYIFRLSMRTDYKDVMLAEKAVKNESFIVELVVQETKAPSIFLSHLIVGVSRRLDLLFFAYRRSVLSKLTNPHYLR